MKKIFKKIILWFFFRYCRDSEWEIYKNNLGHLLSEVKRSVIRDILTRTDAKKLRQVVLECKDDHETIISLISKSFTEQNYYDNK